MSFEHPSNASDGADVSDDAASGADGYDSAIDNAIDNDATEAAASDGSPVPDGFEVADAADVPEVEAVDSGPADGPVPTFFLSGRYDHVTRFTGDVDGDGNLDLLSYSVSDSVSRIQVWLGHGDGTFETSPVATSFSTALFQGEGERTWGHMADLDGDGHADFVMEDSQAVPGDVPSRFRFFRLFGKADATFELRVQSDPSVDGAFTLFGIADFTSDGRDDLLLVGESPWRSGDFKTVVVSYQGPSAAEVSRTAPAESVCCLLASTYGTGIGDIDGDGKLDYAADTFWLNGLTPETMDSRETNRWWRGLGNGTFGPATDLPTLDTYIWDVDLDGKAEMVRAGNVSWNLGGSMFSAPSSLPFLGTAGDFNADGKVDFWGGTGSGYAVAFGEGSHTWAAPSPRPVRATLAGDYDKDGTTDIILVEPGGPTSIYLSTLKGARPRAPDVRCEPMPAARCAATAERPDNF